MIQYKTGDILQDTSDALVNTVNCVGVMGRGIALQFKKAFPENFREYEKACKQDEVKPGRMFVHETGTVMPPRFIINFPTKRHWRGKSRMEDIENGLEGLKRTIKDYGIDSIAIPPLGSGLGGLNWNQVKSRIEKELGSMTDVRITVYEPKGAPSSEKMTHVREIPTMTAGRAALVELMHRYLCGLLDPMVTLLEVHKLMYFMQEAGQPLKLRFKKAPYGPYAENLRHVLHAIEGYFISGYADGGDTPEKKLELIPGASEEAGAFLSRDKETLTRFKEVSQLVEGFESPFGLELLSTVHWVVKHEGAATMDEIQKKTYSWNSRKRQFTPRQIRIAVEVLKQHGWVALMEGTPPPASRSNVP
ncbi:MAG: macro domain-containing protein [Desulfatibacillaceae bacterium]